MEENPGGDEFEITTPEVQPIPPELTGGDKVSLTAHGKHDKRQLILIVKEVAERQDQYPQIPAEYHTVLRAEVDQDITAKPGQRLHQKRNGSRPLLVLINHVSTLTEGGSFDYVNPNQGQKIQPFDYCIEQLRIEKPKSESKSHTWWQRLGRRLVQIAKSEEGELNILKPRIDASSQEISRIQKEREKGKARRKPQQSEPLSEDEMINKLFGGHWF